MDARFSPKTDQRAGVRPISFVLDDRGSLGEQVMLPVRPEDLTRNEPARATVYQTLGRGVQGWVDHFGEGMPSVTISGHTGWNFKPGLGLDGFESFEKLNDLVVHQYPAAKQAAIDSGSDPAGVKLLFVDLLDDFAWEVVPTQFVLRRSKSRPLLFQYNISMQAIRTSVDGGLEQFVPFFGTVPGGQVALDSAVSRISGMTENVQKAMFPDLRGIASQVMKYVNMAVGVLRKVQGVISDAKGFIDGAAGQVIGIAKGISMVGREVFRTMAAIIGLGASVKAAFSQMAAAFNEVVCIFSNALRPRAVYEEYTGLYGASNCSSTTGGRMPSAFSNSNVFAVINDRDPTPVKLSGSAITSIGAVTSSDPVLRPLPQAEIGRHLGNITSGTEVFA